MDNEVTKFEESILFFADAHKLHGPGSKFRDQSSAGPQTPIVQVPPVVSFNGSGTTTPSPPPSIISSNDPKRFSFGHRLLNLLKFSVSADIHIQELSHFDDDFVRESNIIDESLEAWQLEAASVDRAIQILPGVKRIIDSIPAGRYAVATSGAKTYGKFYFYIYLTCLQFLNTFSKPTVA